MATVYGIPPPAPPPDPPELPEGVDPGPRWPWWYALAGFFTAILGALVIGGLIGAIAVAAGGDLEESTPTVAIVGTLVQDVIFVGTAIAFASFTLRPRAWHFGFRRTRFWWAVLWAFVGLVTFYLVSVVYSLLLTGLGLEQEQTTLEDLGVDEGRVALVSGAILVIVVAPLVEELFFRGFLYRSLRSSLPVWAAALIAGAVFGLVHVFTGAIAVPLLAFFGIVLCLVYEQTGSLYPVIAMHALVNMLAFMIDTEEFALSLGLGAGVLAMCVLAPRFFGRGVPAPA